MYDLFERFACKIGPAYGASEKNVSDKNSISWMRNIGEKALYVNGKMPTTYAVLGLGYGRRACEGCQAQGGIFLQRWNLSCVSSFLAKSG